MLKEMQRVYNEWFCKDIEARSKESVPDELRLRVLPMNMPEFEGWSERIMESAEVPATKESQQFALAGMLLSLGNSVCEKEDLFFINHLRKAATNQTAQQVIQDIKAARAKEVEKPHDGPVACS